MNTITTSLPANLDAPSRLAKIAAWRPAPGDLRAAWVSSIVMVPQAVAFAVIAGLPPEMGLYASVVPVIVAALLGASARLLSGPNTAVSVMIGAALLPLAAPGGCDYLALVAVLTAMVGIVQLVAAACGAGTLLALLPPFVSHGLTAGIGFVMIGSQLAPATGLLSLPEASPWISAWSVAINHAAMNPYAIAVCVSALLLGHLCGRFKVPGLPPLVAAMVGGSLVAWLLDVLFGAAVVDVDRIGHLQVLLMPWSVPALRFHEWFVIKQLVYSAVAIAVVGGLQTVMISRAVCADDPRLGNPRREVFAQGMANLSAAFTGGFAGSGSFNRTAAHVKAGAQTRLAGVMSSIFLLAMAWIAGPLFAYIALPAVAGTIALIGWGMLRSGLLGFWPDRGFPRAAALGAVVSALVVGVEASLTLVTLLGFLSLVLAHRRSPVATRQEPQT